MEPLDILKKELEKMVELDSIEWEMISKYISVRNLKEKEILDKEGQEAENLYFLTSGILRSFRVRKGKEYTHDLYVKPRFVANITGLVNKVPAMHTIQALVDSTVIVLNHKKAQKLYDVFPKYDRIGRMLTESVLMHEIARIDMLACYEPLERYVKVIEESPDLLQRISQKYIASYLGVSPESLSRMKAKLMCGKV